MTGESIMIRYERGIIERLSPLQAIEARFTTYTGIKDITT